MMDKLRRALSGNDAEDEERGFVAQVRRKRMKCIRHVLWCNNWFIKQVVESSTLSWGTRVKGFIACFVIGISLSVIGSVCLFFGTGGLVAFSVFYTAGNITAMLRYTNIFLIPSFSSTCKYNNDFCGIFFSALVSWWDRWTSWRTCLLPQELLQQFWSLSVWFLRSSQLSWYGSI